MATSYFDSNSNSDSSVKEHDSEIKQQPVLFSHLDNTNNSAASLNRQGSDIPGAFSRISSFAVPDAIEDLTPCSKLIFSLDELPAPEACRICGKTAEQDTRAMVRFLPAENAPSDISLHIFCGKTATILSHIAKPEYEIILKAGIKTKHGIGDEVDLALSQSRSAIGQGGEAENDPRRFEKRYYLVKEFERNLNAIKSVEHFKSDDRSGNSGIEVNHEGDGHYTKKRSNTASLSTDRNEKMKLLKTLAQNSSLNPIFNSCSNIYDTNNGMKDTYDKPSSLETDSSSHELIGGSFDSILMNQFNNELKQQQLQEQQQLQLQQIQQQQEFIRQQNQEQQFLMLQHHMLQNQNPAWMNMLISNDDNPPFENTQLFTNDDGENTSIKENMSFPLEGQNSILQDNIIANLLSRNINNINSFMNSVPQSQPQHQQQQQQPQQQFPRIVDDSHDLSSLFGTMTGGINNNVDHENIQNNMSIRDPPHDVPSFSFDFFQPQSHHETVNMQSNNDLLDDETSELNT